MQQNDGYQKHARWTKPGLKTTLIWFHLYEIPRKGKLLADQWLPGARVGKGTGQKQAWEMSGDVEVFEAFGGDSFTSKPTFTKTWIY